MLDQSVYPLVVVVRVVVKQGKLFDPGLQGERDRIVHATVPPTKVFLVFLGIVLRIEDQQIHVAQEFDHIPVLATRARLGVGEKGDQAVGREQPVADAKARMIGPHRPSAHRADVEVEVLEFLDFDVARQFVERHGKIGAFHLAGQGIDQAFARTFTAQNPEPAMGIINRPEKRQALNVVPMRVGQQHGQIQRPVLEFRQQRTAQRPQSRAGVEEDDFSAHADFDAGRVAAIAHGGRPRRRNRAAHAPEFYASGDFDGLTLTRVVKKTNRKYMIRRRECRQQSFRPQFIPKNLACHGDCFRMVTFGTLAGW